MCLQSFKTDSREIKISMDGKGLATDNILIERFWRTIKRGYVYLHPVANGVELYRGVGNYIEYYNYSKGHTAHNELPPCVAYGVTKMINVERSNFGEERAVDLARIAERRQNYLRRLSITQNHRSCG